MLKNSVLLIAFNRPATTQQVLEALAIYQPPVLYVATDGARKGNANDAIKCAAVHELVNNWQKNNPDVEVKTLYQPENLGCGLGVSTAINWFFSNEEMGIILEDDCLPNQSFFTFCNTLLHQYKDDDRIMHIAGSNFIEPEMKVNNESYYFSIYPHIWGWASWRRAWSKYDFEMKKFEEFKQLPAFNKYYDQELFEKTKSHEIDTWDSQWAYTILMAKGVSVIPNYNFVKNLGFDENGGSHHNKTPNWYKGVVYEITEIKHPEEFILNTCNDDLVYEKVIKRGISHRLKRFLKKIFN
ncbi:hypothetical protein [Ferruginibacter sp. SUN106]|uniref:hypothetical protein n=1 Tax=Ferruginibacter sp. SUN106 TaxID=2978348 RepID=UPI003D36A91E